MSCITLSSRPTSVTSKKDVSPYVVALLLTIVLAEQQHQLLLKQSPWQLYNKLFFRFSKAIRPTSSVQFEMLQRLHEMVSLQVETIGDAYMVVGGVPEVNDTHASSVANMAIDMMFKVREVMSPATGEPLKVCFVYMFYSQALLNKKRLVNNLSYFFLQFYNKTFLFNSHSATTFKLFTYIYSCFMFYMH